MPNDAFFKLSKEKQEELVSAAKKEFTNHPLREASINRIIQDIHMPRGTFYLYFNDIYELYFYVIGQYFNRIFDALIENLKRTNGDLFLSYQNLFDSFLTSYLSLENPSFYKNVFSNMTVLIQERLIHQKNPLLEGKWIELRKWISTEQLHVSCEEDLLDILTILTNVTLNHIGLMALREIDPNLVKKRYQNKMRLLAHGMKKEELC